MRRLAPVLLAALAVISVAGCKKKKNQTAPEAAKDAAVAAAPDSGDAAPDKGAKLSLAPIPQPATSDDCQNTGDHAAALLRVMALDRKVPNDKIDGVEQELRRAFIDTCNADAWPEYVLDCVGAGRAEVFTWQRCVTRFPETQRIAWDAKMDAIIGKAGGTATAATQDPAPEGGIAFEKLCEVFVSEMARLDDCAGGALYVPEFENVFVAGRAAAVGGQIPPDRQAGLKELCDKTTAKVRTVEATHCAAQVH